MPEEVFEFTRFLDFEEFEECLVIDSKGELRVELLPTGEPTCVSVLCRAVANLLETVGEDIPGEGSPVSDLIRQVDKAIETVNGAIQLLGKYEELEAEHGQQASY